MPAMPAGPKSTHIVCSTQAFPDTGVLYVIVQWRASIREPLCHRARFARVQRSCVVAAQMEAFMKYRTLDELAPVAQIGSLGPEALKALRRKRLERLADVLDAYDGPFGLLSRIEYLPKQERMSARAEDSPLALAFQDPILRGQGLASDRVGDAMSFFDLSWREAHHLFCDCHYTAGITARIVADRVRSLAHRLTFVELWARVRNTVTSRLGRITTLAGS